MSSLFADNLSSRTGTAITISSGFRADNNMIESGTVNAAKLSDSTDINLTNGMVHYFSTAETTTSTPNFRSGVGINTMMSIGDVISVTLISTSTNTAAYSARVSIDDSLSGITTVWNGGESPTEGTGSGNDVYSYSIQKTGNATYRVYATVTNFG